MTRCATTTLIDDRFLLLERAGSGGMATVYRAYDRVDRREVALKVGRAGRRCGPSHPLAGEFDVWCRIRHRNVVRAYEWGIARCGPLPSGTPYLVLEAAAGDCSPLATRRTATGSELERLAVHALRAIDHVERAGWVHRDIKPANILTAGRPSRPVFKLTDFGLAVERGRRDAPGRLNGSLPYLAPECLLGGAVDGRTDLYALGVTLHRLATGSHPARGRTAESLLRWHLGGPPADPAVERPGLPDRFARLVRRLTARAPQDRPASAAAALELLDHPPPSDRRPPPVPDRALRARLRLALDAARLGARREISIPARAVGWREPLRSWAQIFGLDLVDLSHGAGDAAALEREILRVLVGMGDNARAAVRCFGLDRSIPLTCVAEQPLPDRSRPPSGDRDDAQTIDGIVGLLAGVAGSRGRVVVARAGSAQASRTRRVVERLRHRLRCTKVRPAAGAGLLLVLVGGAARPSPTATAPGSPCRAG